MEVVAAPHPSTGGTPFRDHDVREWSRIDSITGALERARLETDSWSANTSDASHRYGKVRYLVTISSICGMQISHLKLTAVNSYVSLGIL